MRSGRAARPTSGSSPENGLRWSVAHPTLRRSSRRGKKPAERSQCTRKTTARAVRGKDRNRSDGQAGTTSYARAQPSIKLQTCRNGREELREAALGCGPPQACTAKLEQGTSHVNATANAFADKCPEADWLQGQPERTNDGERRLPNRTTQTGGGHAKRAMMHSRMSVHMRTSVTDVTRADTETETQ